ncbi:cytochrome P450, partial [Flagelloscypha sp. PMI_526]
RRSSYALDFPRFLFVNSCDFRTQSFLKKLFHSVYKRFNSDVVALRVWFKGIPEIYTNNIDVARQVAVGGHKTSYLKPELASRALLFWGMNLVAADQDMWRKHRRILGVAFNNKLYQAVLSKSMDIYDQMVSFEGWDKMEKVEINGLQHYTFKFALLVIGICGFGFEDFTWATPPATADGTMTVGEAVKIATEDNMLHTFLPKWMFNLPFDRMRKSRTAVSRMKQFMQEQVQRRKSSLHNATADASAFSMLVKASEEEGEGKFALDDDELIGNIFVLLFAGGFIGHETTAHTLASTLAFLALDHNIQDEVYGQILSVFGKDRRPGSVEELYKLNKLLEVFMEALRLYPAGHIMIREAYEDTILTVPKPIGEEGTYTVPIQKGTRINVDMIGVQYNPRYFEDPKVFKPSRWAGVSPDSEQFTAFSVGARSCLGRKFALVESLSFLFLFLRDWKVEPKLNKGESKEQWQTRVMAGKMVITLGINDIPLILTRRT